MEVIRRARRADIAAVAALFQVPAQPLLDAFELLDADSRVALVVAEDDHGIVGTAQLTILRGLSWQGMPRGLVEGVRATRRGVTSALLAWAIKEATKRGCTRLHLDSGLARGDLSGYYARFGFEHSYQGFTRSLGYSPRE
ncbi:GNAT family N-acetyltransferase [Amycolatopsis sp. NPDC059021]|uniref:GNAT family N-acetyltransferase n=1 Tax=Amycolatopsis sp. NPDC059021 TaxID=3346704 RepID=UPI00366FCC2C